MDEPQRPERLVDVDRRPHALLQSVQDLAQQRSVPEPIAGRHILAVGLRRALVTHMVPSTAQFDPIGADPIYTRYRRRDHMTMDESYFPILWDKAARRSEWLSSLPQLPGAGDSGNS